MSQQQPRQSTAESHPDIRPEIDSDSSRSNSISLSKSNLERHTGHTQFSNTTTCRSPRQRTSEWIQQHAISPLETHQTVPADLFWGQPFSGNSIYQVEPRDAFSSDMGVSGTLSSIQYPLLNRVLTESEKINSHGVESTSGSSSKDDAWTSGSSGGYVGTISSENSLLPFTLVQDSSPSQIVGLEGPPQSTVSSPYMSVRSPVTGFESFTDTSTIPWEFSNLRAGIRQLRDEARNLNDRMQHLDAASRLLPEPVIDQRGRRHAFAIPSALEDYASESTLKSSSSSIECRTRTARTRIESSIRITIDLTVDLSMRQRTASEDIIYAFSRQVSVSVCLSVEITTGQMPDSHATNDEIVIEDELSPTRTEGDYQEEEDD